MFQWDSELIKITQLGIVIKIYTQIKQFLPIELKYYFPEKGQNTNSQN